MAKIKDVRLVLNKYSYRKPFHITGSISSEANNVDVELLLDNGIVARGEASPSFRVNGEKTEMLLAMEDFLRENLIGLDVRNYGEIFEITDKLLATPSLKAAVQFATLDGLCEELGITVAEFLGGAKTEIETDKTVGIDTIENRLKDAEEIFKEGFRTIKVKVGENLKEDIDAMLEIARLTKGASYIVDANMGYTPKQAVEFANALYRSGVDIAVYEQPVVWYDIEELRYVRFHCPFPVAADESAKRKYDVLRLIKEEAVDYINIKLMKSGISDALAIVEMAKASNVKLMIGCMAESSLGINQSVQFALGTGAFDFHDLDSHLLLEEPSFRGKFVQDGPKMKLR
ncbi:MAG: Mandelate racemase/muconate lactonizing protein [Thermotoga sp. 50_1627]|uniref:L-Ala-D/L-Glu epimerase n=1 Tax=Pseudothermotoga sp. TaxID=2033661 RepID=UPI00076BF5BF|nr:MAG: Mandelate racemase/muconate lactonizing protein [Thermotoga sp. 50_64]KUK24780.1 MAG: Mandelate racemase/muconate lactonizing protein [Thermotoga sp. 50_1627]MBC7116457.1 dipeptide epimerase [Pseudothermotoga sp.]MDK2924124.1 L-Ala-D/L-Glu epimerase [Pseudothermotoga sp.]HBT40316.1 dipeptide epimerase [Pseudothermotoga sp.]